MLHCKYYVLLKLLKITEIVMGDRFERGKLWLELRIYGTLVFFCIILKLRAFKISSKVQKKKIISNFIFIGW